ncbi:hypothetical protein RRF57_002081 [Xylaria bambusicola]|uniref:Uncharacterized protein n=1 Tax=Xylaria bambusicola TaxID=326684 RepID=A0AAN7UJR6_9PEZI
MSGRRDLPGASSVFPAHDVEVFGLEPIPPAGSLTGLRAGFARRAMGSSRPGDFKFPWARVARAVCLRSGVVVPPGIRR